MAPKGGSSGGGSSSSGGGSSSSGSGISVSGVYCPSCLETLHLGGSDWHDAGTMADFVFDIIVALVLFVCLIRVGSLKWTHPRTFLKDRRRTATYVTSIIFMEFYFILLLISTGLQESEAVVTYLYYLIFIIVSLSWRIGEILLLAIVFRTIYQHLSPLNTQQHHYVPAYQAPTDQLAYQPYGGTSHHQSAYMAQTQGLMPQKPVQPATTGQTGGHGISRAIITLLCVIATAALGLYITYIVYILMYGFSGQIVYSKYYRYTGYVDVGYFSIYLLCTFFFVGAAIHILMKSPSKAAILILAMISTALCLRTLFSLVTQCITTFKPALGSLAFYTAMDILYAIFTSVIYIGVLLVGSIRSNDDGNVAVLNPAMDTYGHAPMSNTNSTLDPNLHGGWVGGQSPVQHGSWVSAQTQVTQSPPVHTPVGHGSWVGGQVPAGNGYGNGNGNWTAGHAPVGNGHAPVGNATAEGRYSK